MASSQSTSGAKPGNPTIVDVEPVNRTVWPDFGTGGVGVEIIDSTGSGFRTFLDWPDAVDFALRTMAATMKLHGITP